MPVVDSHCHASPVWYEPVESLLWQMERNGVERAILIQMQGQFNNDYQYACARDHPGKFVPVAVIDTQRPDAAEELARQAAQGAGGVRFLATTRSPGDDPLLIWRAAARLGLPVSCGGALAAFAGDDFAALVATLPELPIVIEHLGGGRVLGDEAADSAQRRRVFDLARFPNAYIKIPGLGEFARRALPVTEPFPFVTPLPPYLRAARDAFGPRRMMWGSDYPPVAFREGYASALAFPRAEFAAMPGVSDEDREWIFGRTALAVFKPRA